jgi:hypothetical protein
MREFRPVRGAGHHLQPTGNHHDQRVARIPGTAHDLAAAERPHPGGGGEDREIGVGDGGQQRSPPQDIGQINRHYGTTLAFGVAGHGDPRPR